MQVVGVDKDSTGVEGGFFVSAVHNNTQQCKWKPKLLTERRPKLKTYNEENIETLGMCIATVNPMGKKHRLQFVVVPKGRQSLIGASDWAW